LIGPVLKFVYDAEAAVRLRGVIPVSLSPLLDSAGGVASLLAVGVLGTSFLRAIAYFFSSTLTSVAGQRVVRAMRANLYTHVLRLPIAYFRRQERGDLVTRLTSDTLELQGAVTSGMSALAQQGLQIALLAGLAVTLDPVLGCLSLTAMPALAWVLRRAGGRVRSQQRDAWDAQGQIASIVEQTATAAPVIKAFTAEVALARRFERLDDEFFRHLLASVRTRALTSPVSEVLGAFALGLTLWYANARVTSGALAPEDFVSFFASVFLLYRPAKGIAETHTWVMQGVAALDRLEAVLGEATEPPDLPDARAVSGLSDAVRFEAAAFAYPDAPEALVLQGVDLALGRGEMVAVVGGSGAGKTTLASLLLRFDDPTAGRVTLDGVDLRSIRRGSLRSLCALVTQEPLLLRDSIAGNITCAEESPDPARLAAAVRATGLDALVASLPKGLDTDVGEAGTRLSGGERQRVCLARAFYRDAPILVLDEATSSLDAEAERGLQDALSRLMEGRTVLLISHRLSSVRYAHRIAVLRDGRIVEQGTHDELWLRGGEYHRLFRAQGGPASEPFVLQS
jgi:subfamily B ATP-binding cassette protein MsbA